MNTDIHVKSDPLPISPVKQYTQFKVGGGGGHVSLVVKISLHTPSVGVVGNILRNLFEKDVFWSVLVYILILFCHVHCLPMK